MPYRSIALTYKMSVLVFPLFGHGLINPHWVLKRVLNTLKGYDIVARIQSTQ